MPVDTLTNVTYKSLMANSVLEHGIFAGRVPRGIPTPDQLGMGMNPYKAFGLLKKAAKSTNKPVKSLAGGTRGGNKPSRGTGKATGGKK